MDRFLGYWGPRDCEILHLPRPSKKHLFFFKKKKEKNNKEREFSPEKPRTQ